MKNYLQFLRLPLCILLLWGFGAMMPLHAQKQEKVSDGLLRLTDQKSSNNRTSPTSPFQLEEEILPIYNGYVVIDAIATTDASQLLKDLQKLGLIKGTAFGRIVSGLLPINAISNMSSLGSLQFARPSYRPETKAGIVTSQGDSAQRSDVARSRFNVDGSGITVGVLSDSYNAVGGADSSIFKGELPGPDNPYGYVIPVDVLEDFPATATDEGRAMLEIIHDVAPGASLKFNTATLGQANFAKGIINLANAGSNVIVDDVIYFAEPFFQDGIVSQAVDQVAASGVSYFSSAGNNDRKSYESEFRASNTQLLLTTSGDTLGEYLLHDFNPGDGVDNFQSITFQPGTSIRLAFQWADPFASACVGCPGANTDLDIFLALTDGNTNSIILGSANPNLGLDPFEFLNAGLNPSASRPVTAYIIIGKKLNTPDPTPNPGLIKYIDFGSGLIPEYYTYSSTCYGHSNAAGAIAVGAARYDRTPAYGVYPPQVEAFSSAGGTPILFDKAGNRIPAIVREKPELCAPQGGNTSFFGFDYEGDGFPNFFGTSASAPHAAGVAALMIEGTGGKSLSPTNIENAMRSTAIDMNDPLTPEFDEGFDFATGSGLLQADAALAKTFRLPSIRHFILINASTGEELGPLPDTIDLATIEGKKINIVAKVEDGFSHTRYVQFKLNMPFFGNKTTFDIFEPYSLFGDFFGYYFPWIPLEGKYKLTATPYTAFGRRGKEGVSLTATFVVINSPFVLTHNENEPNKGHEDPTEVAIVEQLAAFPNPVKDQLIIQSTAKTDGPLSIKIYDMRGKVYLSKTLEVYAGYNHNILDLTTTRMAPGFYLLEVQSGQQDKKHLKLVKE